MSSSMLFRVGEGLGRIQEVINLVAVAETLCCVVYISRLPLNCEPHLHMLTATVQYTNDGHSIEASQCLDMTAVADARR